MKYASRPETELEIEKMIEVFQETTVGQVVTHEALTKLIGRDAQRSARHVVAKAIKIYSTGRGLRFACVRGVGYKKLSGTDLPGLATAHRKKISGQAKRGYEDLTGLDGYNLSRADQQALDASRSVFGAISALASDNLDKRVQDIQAQSTGPVPAHKVFEALSVPK